VLQVSKYLDNMIEHFRIFLSSRVIEDIFRLECSRFRGIQYFRVNETLPYPSLETTVISDYLHRGSYEKRIVA
jgi:hypothetical protein